MHFRQITNIDTYVDSIRGIPAITPAREIELASVIAGGGPGSGDALRELIESNLRLVVKIAHDFKRFSLDFADIVAEGNVGLMIAARKFRPGHGAKFSCYAAWWIKQSIRKALAENTRTIRLPVEQAKRYVRVVKARAAMETAGEDTSDAAVAAAAGVSEDSVRMLLMAPVHTASLEDPVGDGDSVLMDVLADDSESRNEQTERLYGALSTLSARDGLIVALAYGLGGRKASLAEIATETGLPPGELNSRLSASLLRLRSVLSSL